MYTQAEVDTAIQVALLEQLEKLNKEPEPKPSKAELRRAALKELMENKSPSY